MQTQYDLQTKVCTPISRVVKYKHFNSVGLIYKVSFVNVNYLFADFLTASCSLKLNKLSIFYRNKRKYRSQGDKTNSHYLIFLR